MSNPDNFQGLSEQEAQAQFLIDGPNELATAKAQNVWQIAWHVISEPMILLLIACGSIYLILGDWHDAVVLSGFVMGMVIISFYQERKTERALEALRDLSDPRAIVIRAGQRISIPSKQVVTGDYLVLSEGDRVAADGILISSLNLTVDESLLTGESLAVTKVTFNELATDQRHEMHDRVTQLPSSEVQQHHDKSFQQITMGAAGGDNTPLVFSGSLVVQGQGIAIVRSTGTNTAIGKIGNALAEIQEEPTRVQKETKHVVKYVALASLSLAILLAVWYGWSRTDWTRGILVGLTFAMAMIPEELPVVLTIFLGIGAWRIGQKNVLTRRIPAIETLGSANVLCVDKTGTLTQNKMALAQLVKGEHQFDCAHQKTLPEDLHEVLEFAVLASQSQGSEPMDQALQQTGQELLGDSEHLHKNWQLLQEYPLTKQLLAISRAWKNTDQNTDQNTDRIVIASKGAPEAIAELCHLSVDESASLMRQVNTMAEQGLRVLAVAKAELTSISNGTDLPSHHHDFNFQLLGLVAFADPIRNGVPAAIQECRDAGIRVMMITGDYPATALNIANQCGIDTSAGALSGTQMQAMSDVELQQQLQHVHVFCRVMPEQKLRIVRLLKQSNAVVAMTGDGVNDAPALKAAHIGIAMGKRGTDVARESADLVLLDDMFSSIVAAVRLGRRIFDNLQKTLSFIIAAHVPIVALSFLPVMFGWPVLLMPVHILILELIIDPSCSLVFEAEQEEQNIMQRLPRSMHSSIFQAKVLWRGFWQGSIIFLMVLAIYWFTIQHGIANDEARAITFTAIVVGNLGFIFLNRSLSGNLQQALKASNPIYWWVNGGTLIAMILILSIANLRQLFYFGNPDALHLLFSAMFAACVVCAIAIMQSAFLKTRNVSTKAPKVAI
jgi:Ca2+-transporting ATPase